MEATEKDCPAFLGRHFGYAGRRMAASRFRMTIGNPLARSGVLTLWEVYGGRCKLTCFLARLESAAQRLLRELDT